jgi:hypothetical protein
MSAGSGTQKDTVVNSRNHSHEHMRHILNTERSSENARSKGEIKVLELLEKPPAKAKNISKRREIRIQVNDSPKNYQRRVVATSKKKFNVQFQSASLSIERSHTNADQA